MGMLLTADPMQAARFDGPVVVDLDDPTYSVDERRALSAQNVKAIVVPTSDVQEAVRGFASPPLLEVIPQGVDVKRARSGNREQTRQRVLGQLQLPHDTPIVGYHAPLLYSSRDANLGHGQAYNVDVLLWASKQLWRGGLTFITVMLGEPSKSVSAAASLEPRLVLPGYTHRSDLFDWVSAFDIGTYPRVVDFQGRQSVKLLEYFACGAPVVATDVSESRIVRKSDAGIVCASRAEFAQALRDLISDSRRRSEIGDHARRVATSYDWEILAPKYDDFLATTIDRFG
jgi:glycosyltransferase involved in cell wall biosynthesis